MADISMCKGYDLDICDRCYRKHAPINEYRQVYFVVKKPTDNKCDEFMRVYQEYKG